MARQIRCRQNGSHHGARKKNAWNPKWHPDIGRAMQTMKESGLTQREVCELIGMRPDEFNDFLCRRRIPSAERQGGIEARLKLEKLTGRTANSMYPENGRVKIETIDAFELIGVLTPVPQPDEIAEKDELMSMLELGMDQLDSVERQIVELHGLQDMSFRKAALILNLSYEMLRRKYKGALIYLRVFMSR